MNGTRFVLLALLIASVGCNKGNPNAPAEISGKVTYKNMPVTAGTVTFYASDNKGAYPVTIKPDGTYSQVDLPIGEMTITVETESINPNKKKGAQPGSSGQNASMSPAPKGSGGGGAPEGIYVKIPEKYADNKKSGLTYTMIKGKQKHDIELTD